ncbi:hypothetical protein AMAG_08021 [Allomyces macrogynus ATCC 38327]|uniref:Tubby C-terminal domain-containing protein n=1 Tax=Allomyces macrogynus (strain ATCC 38327) TaxID=578462 RepID=A0A0L0SK28_ALLM3|nr:hypothetical protein AMAG_08021 [Allomyces macrogynus ATCC 38327]|eukprot:KNE62841.1 hypothetical protein AMAG_08021 [Allomyces macrogynus ATCC 38327]
MGGTQSKYQHRQVTDDALRDCKYAPLMVVDESYVVPLDQPMRTLLVNETKWSPFSADNDILDPETKEKLFVSSGNVLGFDAFELLDFSLRKSVLVCHSRDLLFNSLFSLHRLPLPDGTKGDRLASIGIDEHQSHMTVFCKLSDERYKDMPGIYVKAASNDMYFFLGHPKEPSSILLARMDATRSMFVPDSMELKIAPGVDMALIVSLCVLADYARRQREAARRGAAAA